MSKKKQAREFVNVSDLRNALDYIEDTYGPGVRLHLPMLGADGMTVGAPIRQFEVLFAKDGNPLADTSGDKSAEYNEAAFSFSSKPPQSSRKGANT